MGLEVGAKADSRVLPMDGVEFGDRVGDRDGDNDVGGHTWRYAFLGPSGRIIDDIDDDDEDDDDVGCVTDNDAEIVTPSL